MGNRFAGTTGPAADRPQPRIAFGSFRFHAPTALAGSAISAVAWAILSIWLTPTAAMAVGIASGCFVVLLLARRRILGSRYTRAAEEPGGSPAGGEAVSAEAIGPAQRSRCFVIMPYGQPDPAYRAHYDRVYEHIIKRALEPIGIECVRSHEIAYGADVMTAELRQLHDSDLVLADVSDSGPNVFYELGYRHAVNKPTIIITERVSDLPFNLLAWAVIPYSLNDVVLAHHSVERIRLRAVEAMETVRQSQDPGLVNIYATRLDAIEEDFFAVMQSERVGIDLVSNTVTGLRGRRRVTRDAVLRLFVDKVRRPHFQLRMLLTHPDFFPYRQYGRDTVRDVETLVSAGFKKDLEWLREIGLTPQVRFYRGAPTCFMVTCHGERMMLANPYPYQGKPYTSWTAVFRQTASFGGVYDQFRAQHFEWPWGRGDLAVPFSDEIMEAVERRLRQELPPTDTAVDT